MRVTHSTPLPGDLIVRRDAATTGYVVAIHPQPDSVAGPFSLLPDALANAQRAAEILGESIQVWLDSGSAVTSYQNVTGSASGRQTTNDGSARSG